MSPARAAAVGKIPRIAIHVVRALGLVALIASDRAKALPGARVRPRPAARPPAPTAAPAGAQVLRREPDQEAGGHDRQRLLRSRARRRRRGHPQRHARGTRAPIPRPTAAAEAMPAARPDPIAVVIVLRTFGPGDRMFSARIVQTVRKAPAGSVTRWEPSPPCSGGPRNPRTTPRATAALHASCARHAGSRGSPARSPRRSAPCRAGRAGG